MGKEKGNDKLKYVVIKLESCVGVNNLTSTMMVKLMY